MNELKELDNLKIELQVGSIDFPEYDNLIAQANEVAEYLKTLEVNEDNIKENKKILAKANKAIKELNDRRIKIKMAILEPYDDFAKKVKNIERIVKEADELVRSQVRDLEEKEREEKKAQIQEIWDKRIGAYEYAKVMTFGDFLESKHLNKTTTLKKVEDEMVETLEKWEKDLKLLSGMEEAKDLIRVYSFTQDVAEAMNRVAIDKEELKRQEQILKNEDLEVKKIYIFKIKDEKDAKLAEMLLKENNIEFGMEEM